MNIPKEILKDLNTAIDILTREGAREIYLFGSYAEGTYSDESDIDIAVIGLKEDKYFKTYGELLSELAHECDLVCIDSDNDFSKILKETAILERVA